MKKRPQRGQTARPAKREGNGDEAWNVFWERLIVDWVAVAVLGFCVQGLWFGLTAFWTSFSPDMGPTLVELSGKLGWLWSLAILGGLGWGLWRARNTRQEATRRR